MQQTRIFTAGYTSALSYAQRLLNHTYTFLPSPDSSISHLLLPVPSFAPDGKIKGGGDLAQVLSSLPKSITVIGGNLKRPELEGYHTIDLLEDSQYLAQNANITAHCAIKHALDTLPVIIESCPVLIIGWGRIGKCLGVHLKQLGAAVSICARKETDRAMACSLGFHAYSPAEIDPAAYRLIFNTAPATVIPECPAGPVKIDLASQRGLGGDDVIWAKGLPNRDAPESSGKLIAQTIIRLMGREER